MARSELEEKVRELFDYSNIYLNEADKKILVAYYVTRRPPAYGGMLSEWIPFSGGPIYGEQALKHCDWLAGHIDKYRELLPKKVRDFSISIVMM